MTGSMTALRPTRLLALGCLLVVFAEPALAGCSDFAQPGVNWRRCLQDGQDLRGADLTGANLNDASFKRADLSEADLTGVDARRAKFVSTLMQDTVLDGANLVRADLTNAEMEGASLRETDLTMAKLFRVDLRNADLTGARLDGSDLLNAQLGGATWVDGVTVCAENSVGQCHRAARQPALSDVEPSG